MGSRPRLGQTPMNKQKASWRDGENGIFTQMKV